MFSIDSPLTGPRGKIAVDSVARRRKGDRAMASGKVRKEGHAGDEDEGETGHLCPLELVCRSRAFSLAPGPQC